MRSRTLRLARTVLLLCAMVALVQSAGAQTTAPMPELDQVRAWLQESLPQFVRGDSGLNGAVLVVDTAGNYVRSIAFPLSASQMSAWGSGVAQSGGLDPVSATLLWACAGSEKDSPVAKRPLCLLDGARVPLVDNLFYLASRGFELLKSDGATKRFGGDGANGAVLVTTDAVALEKFRSVGATPATFVEFSSYAIRRRADGQNVVITVLMLRRP